MTSHIENTYHKPWLDICCFLIECVIKWLSALDTLQAECQDPL